MVKPSYFRAPLQNQVNPDPYHEIKTSSVPHNEIKSISTTHTITKSSSMLTLKRSIFVPAYENQVNFDHPHNEVNIPNTKIKSFSAARKSHVN